MFGKKDIKRGLQYYHDEAQLLISNDNAIVQLNRRVLQGLLIGSCIMCASGTIITLLGDGNGSVAITYGVTTLAFIVVTFVNGFIPNSWVLPSFYLFFAAMLAYSAYSAAIVYPDYTGVISLGVFILMPVLILDKSVRSAVVEIASLAVYLAYVIPRKAWVVHQDEAIYNVSFAILGLILGRYLRRVRLSNQELLRQSIIRETTDVLTGLFNRRKLFDCFIEYESGKAEMPITGISMLDIDYFKTYNDTYGHLAGDTCLRKIGKCFNDYGKQHNMEFYRYGGEEFVTIAHEQDKEVLKKDFENIVAAVENLQIKRKDSVVTVSQGILFMDNQIAKLEQTVTDTDENTTEGNHLKAMHFQKCLSKADAALYQAKEQGRNRSVFAT